MATVQNLVDDTLIMIGAVDPGESPNPSESNHAFAQLNRILGSWSAAGVPVLKVTKDVFTLTGAASYTIGASGTIAVSRPLKIKAANIVSGDMSQPVEPVTAEQFAAVSIDRSRAGRFAKVLLYDAAYPTANIHFWPTPANGGSFELYSLKPLALFTALTDVIDLSPGYELAMKYALAGVIAPGYGRALSPDVVAGAQEAKESIARLNIENLGSAVPAEAPQVTK